MTKKNLTTLITIALIIVISIAVNVIYHQGRVLDEEQRNLIIKDMILQDSIDNLQNAMYQKKIDSIIEVYNVEIKLLKSKDEKLSKRIDIVNADVGELPDFRAD